MRVDAGHLYISVHDTRDVPISHLDRAAARTEAQAAIDAASREREFGLVDERAWQRRVADALASSYLRDDDPRWQSGFDGDAALWREARELVLDAVPADATTGASLLDVGCANGHLMECLDAWARERGLALTLYGLELSPELAEAARRRLPTWAGRIYTGNVSDWAPPRRFTYVRTGLEYVCAGDEPTLIARLLGDVVAPGGRLIVGPVSEADVSGTLEAFAAASVPEPGVAGATDRNGKTRHIVWADAGPAHLGLAAKPILDLMGGRPAGGDLANRRATHPVPPSLPPTFRTALGVITRELAARTDVAAVLFFGSAARGEATAGSDLDLYGVTRGDARGHLGRIVAGVPVEVSFGSAAQWRALLDGERPAVVHAFATGRLLLDHTDGEAARLCADAAALWARGPAPPDAAVVLRWRFRLTDLARDLEAMPERSPATALAGAECVRAAVEAFCAARRVWPPPARRVLAVLESREPAFAAAVRACAEAGFPAFGAVGVADLALGAVGGRLEAYDTTGGSTAGPLGAAS